MLCIKCLEACLACHMGVIILDALLKSLGGAFSYSIYVLKCLICIMLWQLWMSVFYLELQSQGFNDYTVAWN